MFSITLHYLDKKSAQLDPELDRRSPKFKPAKLAKCFTMLREDNYELFKAKVIRDIQSGEPDAIAPYISAFSKPLDVYKTWGWDQEVNVGLVLHTQHIEDYTPVLKTVLIPTWADWEVQKDAYFKLEPMQPGFFSSGAIVLYKP